MTATTATTPVLNGGWLAPGTHVNVVGATRPDWRELDDAVQRRARLNADSREASLQESRDVIAAGKIVAELGKSSPERNRRGNPRTRSRSSNRSGWRWKTT